jgi:hypothetical protein
MKPVRVRLGELDDDKAARRHERGYRVRLPGFQARLVMMMLPALMR